MTSSDEWDIVVAHLNDCEDVRKSEVAHDGCRKAVDEWEYHERDELAHSHHELGLRHITVFLHAHLLVTETQLSGECWRLDGNPMIDDSVQLLLFRLPPT